MSQHAEAALLGTRQEHWTWPIDISAYDRAESISPEELETLREIMRRQGTVGWSPAYEIKLARLLGPIRDVLFHTRSARRGGQSIVSNLCREMFRRKATYWAWSTEEWIEVISHSVRVEHYRGDFICLAYLLCGFNDIYRVGHFFQPKLASKIFGTDIVAQALTTIREELAKVGYGHGRLIWADRAVAELLLIGRSPYLKDITPETLERVYLNSPAQSVRAITSAVSHALVALSLIKEPLAFRSYLTPALKYNAPLTGVPPEWADWCLRWRTTTTYQPVTTKHFFPLLLAIGRWLQEKHPEITGPGQWTRETAAECVAMVQGLKIGQYTVVMDRTFPEKVGYPMRPASKAGYLSALRAFFKEIQEWEWIERRFDPRRSFAIPRNLLAQLKPNPRVISDDAWFKLLNAGLNITQADLPQATVRKVYTYPLEMVKAVAATWLFAGLRSDELIRLRVECIRWLSEDVTVTGTGDALPKGAVCLIEVPVNKTGNSFTKPVDPLVGRAIEAWVKVRPLQPVALDSKTSEQVHYLFSLRGKRLGHEYVNKTLIPILCRKAGIPESDAEGRITSHRARHTIATQLFNARDPMSLTELQEWLGHSSPHSTQYYARITPTRLMKSYADAGYFNHALRTIEVLIDQQAIKEAAASRGQPWMYYDLGHGFCTYDYFSQCPHRLACARCAFYIPKQSSQAQLLESKGNLLRLKQEISLTEDEIAAVDEGLDLMNKLLDKLADTPTPAGPTPREIRTNNELETHRLHFCLETPSPS